MSDRVTEIQNMYEAYLASNNEDEPFPYERYMEETNLKSRMFKILGPSSEADVNFINDAYLLSVKKKKILKVNHENKDGHDKDSDQDDGSTSESEESFKKTNKRPKTEKPRREVKTTTTTERKDFLSFLRLWISTSNLFHPVYPKTQHSSYFKLRIQKLAEKIYEYLHEENYYYGFCKEKFDACEDIDIFELMNGNFVPKSQMIDPALDRTNSYNAEYFPLEGNFDLLQVFVVLLVVLKH